MQFGGVASVGGTSNLRKVFSAQFGGVAFIGSTNKQFVNVFSLKSFLLYSPDPSMPGAGKRLFTVQISKTLESFESSSGIQLSLSKIVTVDVTKK